MIRAEKLSKNFGDHQALVDISFTLLKNQIMGLVGRNGSGKTTLLKLIAGTIQPSQGSIHFDDTDSNAPIKIGFLPDQPPLYRDMCVFEYLLFIAKLHDVDQAQQKVTNVIELCSLGTVATKKISLLSYGFKQRVSLAQAIVHSPQILLLDEPINGLDPLQIVELRKILLKLKSTMSIILSSHILEEIRQTCDSVLLLEEGRLVGLSKSPSDFFTDLSDAFKI